MCVLREALGNGFSLNREVEMKEKKRLHEKGIHKRALGFRETQTVAEILKREVQEGKHSIPAWRGRKLLRQRLDFRFLPENDELLSGFKGMRSFTCIVYLLKPNPTLSFVVVVKNAL